MRFWYIVEAKSDYDTKQKTIGASISAEIVDVKPRGTSGDYEWHDTESIEANVYTRRHWCKTQKEAKSVIRHHMTTLK